MYFSIILPLEHFLPRNRSIVAASDSFFTSDIKFWIQQLLIAAGSAQSKHHKKYKSCFEKSSPERSARHWFLAIALILLSNGDSSPCLADGRISSRSAPSARTNSPSILNEFPPS